MSIHRFAEKTARVFVALAFVMGMLTPVASITARPAPIGSDQLTLAAPLAPQSNAIRISQVYGGGGAASGSPAYKNDYVELFNSGAAAIDIGGWSLQYGSATGNFASSSTNIYTFTSGTTVQPSKYLLVQLGSAGTVGPNLAVTPDITTTNLSMSASSGKVALTNIGSPLGCGGTSAPCTLPDSRIVDLVAYGNVTSTVEITAANYPTALDSTKGVVRKSGGCQDTDNNYNDFTVVVSPTLTPRNSASPANPCTATIDILVLAKSAPSLASLGDTLDYTISVSNTSSVTATSTVVTDTLPTEVNFVTYTTSLANSFSQSGNQLIWQLGDILSQTNGLTISVQVTIPTSVIAQTVLTNTVTASTLAAETVITNNIASAITTVRQADLKASKTGLSVMTPGEQVTYTINISNIGYPATADLVVTDTLPAAMTYVTDTSGVAPSVAGNAYVWNLTGLAAGGAVQFDLVAGLSSGTPFGTILTNTVDVATSSSEESTANNLSQVVSSVGGPDLVVSKTAPATAQPAEVISFTLVVANGGAIAATNVWLTDTLPVQVAYAGDSLGFAAQNGQDYGWSLGTITPGHGVTFTVAVTVSPAAHAGDVLTNLARATQTEIDQNPADNVYTTTTTVVGADPYVLKSGPALMFGGEVATYTIVYGNNGNLPAEVTVTDTLPISFTVADIAQDASGLNIVVNSGNTRAWTATIAAGERVTFTLALTVPTVIATNTRVTNTVNLTTAVPGNAPANDQAQAGAPVYQIVPIAAARAGSNLQVFGMEGRVTVVPLTFGTNEWELQDDSGGISAFYSPPPSVALGDRVRLVATRGAFNNQEQMATPVYYFAKLGSGPEVVPLRFTTGQVASGATEGWLVMISGVISNLPASCTGNHQFDVNDGTGATTVFVDGDTGAKVCSPDWSNGDRINVIGFSTQYQSLFEVKPRRPSDVWRPTGNLYIAKSAPGSVLYNSAFTYTLTARNDLGLTATNVLITDSLPLSLTINGASDGGQIAGNVVSWTVASLDPDASVVRTIQVTAPGNLATLVNADYGISASEYVTRVIGALVTTRVVQQDCSICRVQGTGGTSPYNGQVVGVTGVIYAKIQTNGPTSTQYGFFMQAQAGASDGDPATSDGLYVFMNTATTISGYTPTVGDQVIITGTVAETNGLTQITNLSGATKLGTVADLNAAIPPTELVPLDGSSADNAYRETLESMRVQVPAGAPVVAPTYFFVSTSDTEIYVIHPNHPVAQRSDPFARRVWRDGEELDWGASTDGNSYRISVEANVLKAKANDYGVQMPRANVYDVVTNTLVGPLTYAFSRFTLMVEDTPIISATVDASANNPPQAPDRVHQYSLATMNVENLYDYLNDPTDGCDFTGDPGCSGVTPPFDYVPANLAAYQAHLAKLAQEAAAMQSPDIIAIEEAEDQDLCANGGLAYGACGAADNPDGQLDVLQDLAQEIYDRSGFMYRTAADRAGVDYRGIIVGYLYRADRVELVPTTTLSLDPVLGLRPTDPVSNTYPHNTLVLNPKAMQTNFSGGGKLFERLPQVAFFRVHRTSVSDSDYVEVYALGNHFKSGPETSIQLRTEQANYNAQLVTDILAVQPGVRAAVLGDLNVYPDSSQLAGLYNAGLRNLHYDIPAASRYSYMYQGQTQTLDQIFVTGALSQTLVAARAAHVNSDWAYDWQPISTTIHQASDHDPTVATFQLPPVPANLNGSSKIASATGQVMPGSLVTYTLILSNSGEMSATVTITDVLSSYYTVYNAMGFTQPTTGTLTWTGVVTGGQSVTLDFVAQVANLPKLALGRTDLNNSATVNDGVNAPFTLTAPNPPWVNIYGIYLPLVSRN